MKKFILLYISIGLGNILFANNEKRIDSKTKEVIVFLNGAQVTRQANVMLEKGQQTIIIEKLSPVIIKESIQLKGIGDFTILSINNRLAYHEKEKNRDSEELKNWKKRKEEIENKLEDIQTLISILNDQTNLFATNKDIQPNNQNVLKADELKAMMEIQSTAIKAAKLELLTHQREIRSLTQELSLLKNKINAAQLIEEEVSSEIHVLIEAKEATKASFQISYLIANARWFPTYDIRVDDISKPLKIVYKANISQQSGEDWENVKLTLSTSDPNKSAQKPTINPWSIYLNSHNSLNYGYYGTTSNFNNPSNFAKVQGQIRDAKTGEAIAYATIQVNGTTIGTTSDLEGFYELTLPSSANQLTVSFIGYKTQTIYINNQKLDILLQDNQEELKEVVVINDFKPENSYSIEKLASVAGKVENIAVTTTTRATRVRGFRINGGAGSRNVITPIKITPIQNVVNKEFRVEDLLSIPSDMQSYHVEIKEIETKAQYEHYCIPKLDPEVFLTAYITDWEQYDLMEGLTNVYFEETFIGSTLLDVRYLSDTLNLSLGRDKSVLVKRSKLKESSKKQFLGSNQIDSRAFEIEVRNAKNQDINLIIQDQFPITTSNDITIEHHETPEGKIDKEKGIIRWDIKLKTKTNQKLTFGYDVKYPKESWMSLE